MANVPWQQMYERLQRDFDRQAKQIGALTRDLTRAERLAARPAISLPVPSAPFYVYVLRDGADHILYIGMTSNLIARLGAHAARQPWWGYVARIEAYDCADEVECANLEKSMIKALMPLNNIAHMPPKWSRKNHTKDVA